MPQMGGLRWLQEQTRVIEEIYAARRSDEQEALKKLGAGAFSSSPWHLGDRQQGGPLVWDYFQPSYNCPSRYLVLVLILFLVPPGA